jgi:colanic acid/amylovoran biosynthesis glycosyltransferase
MHSSVTDMRATTRVGYVMTHHPRVATTFITNEIDELRQRGAEIVPIAMNLPRPDDLPTEASRAERSRTLYLKAAGPLGLLRSTLRVASARPVAFLGLVIRALDSARLDPSIAVRRLAHLAYASLAVEHCRAHGITHLHAHFGQAPATIAWFTAEIGNLRDREKWTWSFTIHGFQDFVNESDARLDLKAASASFVICVSDFTRSQLCRVTDPLLWDRFHVVRCGIDLDAFSLRPSRPMPASPRILVVARLSAEKGHVVLLHALARLRAEGSGATLDIVGSGPYEAEIRAEVSRLGLDDAVRQHGELASGEVDRHLRDADVFCLPSFSEGLPVSIMEAMAIGVPVVATAISGIPELAVHDETALTVPPANEEALASALRRMLGDSRLAETVAAAGRVAVEHRHDLHANVAKLAALFDSAVESPIP